MKLGENLDDLGSGNNILGRTPKAQSMKKRKELRSCISLKLKISVLWRKMKTQATDLEKQYLQKYTSDNGIWFKTDKELIKLNHKKTNILVKKWAKDPNIHFIKADIEMTKNTWRYSTSYVIREMQNKTTVRHLYTSIRTAKIWIPAIP